MTATGGKIIVTAGVRPQPPETSLLPLYTQDISVLGFVISLAETAELAEAARAINKRPVNGGFTIKAAGTFS